MFRDDLQWYKVTNIKQAWELLQENDNIVYAGGLGINRNKSEKIRGFINICDLPLKYIKYENNKVIVGAGVSVAELIESPVNKGNVYSYICHAFSKAASTPIRNRMTIGGLCADFPIWSDILPALIAANAEVTIYNGKEIYVPVEEYIEKTRKEKHIVLNVSFDNHREGFAYYSERLTQVRFDYSAVIVNMAGIVKDNIISDLKVVVSGTKTKISIFDYKTHNINSELSLKLDFPKDARYSAEYKKQIADVYIKEGLKNMTGREI
jgi:CO/xanthine dehydrogenase FAD-binding subunit